MTMIQLEYFDGKNWTVVGMFHTEDFAWMSLGGDDANYRTVDESGNVLTDKQNNQADRP